MPNAEPEKLCKFAIGLVLRSLAVIAMISAFHPAAAVKAQAPQLQQSGWKTVESPVPPNDHTLGAALMELAEFYRTGHISPEDAAIAEAFYRQFSADAVGDNNVLAVLSPAELFDKPSTGPVDLIAAMRTYQRAATAGKAEAYLKIGDLQAGVGAPAQDYASAIVNYRLASSKGVTWGDVRYGELIARGIGVPQDLTRGLAIIRRVAEIADSMAYVVMGDILSTVEMTGPDRLERAVDAYLNASNAGHALGFLRLGDLFLMQDNGLYDEPRARSYYRQAASKVADQARAESERRTVAQAFDPENILALERLAGLGSSRATYLLGRYYYSGENYELDYRKAFELFETAAKDNQDALLMMGQMLALGQGVPQDYERGRSIVEGLSNAGHSAALMTLARLLLDEDTGTIDTARSVAALVKAAKLGRSDALVELARLYEEGDYFAPDVSKALRLYLEAAQKGSSLARLKAARLLIYGAQADRNVDEALRMLQAEVQNGNVDARIELGNVFADPKSGLANLEDAIVQYSAAVAAGRVDALIHLGDIYQDGALVTADYGRARAYYQKAAKWSVAGTRSSRAE